MKMKATAILFAMIAAHEVLAAPKQAEVPKYDIAKTCRAAGAYAGSNKDLAYKGCVRDESDARAELIRKWTQFNAQDRADCIAQGAEPMPSYVELLTCLEISAEVSALNSPGGRIRDNAAGASSAGAKPNEGQQANPLPGMPPLREPDPPMPEPEKPGQN
ncbi:MAG TPA: hypothetical protein VFG05_09815 [Methylocella sp.]|nr:hypothetical protein [Methylocella sp.]